MPTLVEGKQFPVITESEICQVLDRPWQDTQPPATGFQCLKPLIARGKKDAINHVNS